MNIKSKILELFCQDELNDLKHYTSEATKAREKYEEKCKSLEAETERIRIMDYINSLHSSYFGGVVSTVDGKSEKIYVYLSVEPPTVMPLETNAVEFTIFLYSNTFYQTSNIPRMCFRLYIKEETSVHARKVTYGAFIDNIFTPTNIENEYITHQGHGTIMMNILLSISKIIGVKEIKGELSYKDKEHFDRLEKYYKKFGFSVIFNDERTKGDIELMLNNSERMVNTNE